MKPENRVTSTDLKSADRNNRRERPWYLKTNITVNEGWSQLVGYPIEIDKRTVRNQLRRVGVDNPVTINLDTTVITPGVEVRNSPITHAPITVGAQPEKSFHSIKVSNDLEFKVTFAHKEILRKSREGNPRSQRVVEKAFESNYNASFTEAINGVQVEQLAIKKDILKDGEVWGYKLPPVRSHFAKLAIAETAAIAAGAYFLNASSALPISELPLWAGAIATIGTTALFGALNYYHLWPQHQDNYAARQEIRNQTAMFGRWHEFFPLLDRAWGYVGRGLNKLAFYEKPVKLKSQPKPARPKRSKWF